MEHDEDFGEGLVVHGGKLEGWRPLAEVWGDAGASWWGPLLPPEWP